MTIVITLLILALVLDITHSPRIEKNIETGDWLLFYDDYPCNSRKWIIIWKN